MPLEQEAFNHYNKNTMSIEVIKDDSLQKINFRVKNKVTACSRDSYSSFSLFSALQTVECGLIDPADPEDGADHVDPVV